LRLFRNPQIPEVLGCQKDGNPTYTALQNPMLSIHLKNHEVVMFKPFRIAKQGIVTLSLTVFLNGCGTITAMKDDGVISMGEWDKKPAKAIVYPGLITDAIQILQYGEWYRVMDFPLSFAADTILLPYTIPSALTDDEANGK
jgi:uncharacterized protein YceK